MLNTLDSWLNQATRCLSSDSKAQVAIEIREHYECSRDAAIQDGATKDQADQIALAALGDSKSANRQYRKVLLTSAEARLLREGEWEARAICSRPLVRSIALCLPAIAPLVAIGLFYAGAIQLALTLLFGGIAMALVLIAPRLPIYTPARSRIVRYFKWVVIAGVLLFAFGGDVRKFSWLLIACLWPMAWVEWRRIVIRRKLPVGRWPKHLYL